MIHEEADHLPDILRDKSPLDEENILSLRPKLLSEYIGQDKIVETLKIAIEAPLKRQESLDHILFNGPPGLGKTTLAHIIANEMGSKIITSSGPALEKGGDLMGIRTHLEKGGIRFLDEIHRIPKDIEEFHPSGKIDLEIPFASQPTIRYKIILMSTVAHCARGPNSRDVNTTAMVSYKTPVVIMPT